MTTNTRLDSQHLAPLLALYRDGLLHDTLPFWIPRAIDREHGGYVTPLNADGSIIHPDKPVWFQGRFAWLLSTLYSSVERRTEWLALARHGIDLMNRCCFDADGRMFFSVTRDGRPLRKRRYLFSEVCATMALAAYGRASGEERYTRQAFDLFKLILHYCRTPGLLPPKTTPEARPMKGLAMPMCLTVTAQELRRAVDNPLCAETIDATLAEIE
jgi:N-acylglucosamine 2-epimerase